MGPDARRRFARQLLLAEVGERGQARLCAHAVRLEGDERAADVARVYLERAGMIVANQSTSASPSALPRTPSREQEGERAVRARYDSLQAGGGHPGHVLEVGSRDEIRALAGRAELEPAAAFLAGAFAAVEEIKRALDVGRAGDLEGVSLIGPEDA